MAKKPTKGMQFLAVVGGVALMTIAEHFPAPLGIAPPTTLLSLIAVLLGIGLGAKSGGVIVTCYVVAVIFGLPPMVWGHAPAIEPFLEVPLAGFNLGLILAAIVAGLLARGGMQSNMSHLALAVLLGHLAYLIVGIAWLTRFRPLAEAAPAVIHSQIIAVLAKSAGAFVIAVGAGRVVKR